MKLSQFSSKLKGGSAIAWEDVTTAHIRQTIRSLEDPLLDVSVKADMGTQTLLSNTRRRFLQSNAALQPLQIQFVVEVKFRSESDLHTPAGWIEAAFDTDDERTMYMNQLVATNEPAFDHVETVELLVEGVAAVERPPDTTDDGGDKKVIIIAAAAGGSALLVGLLGLVFWSNQQSKEDDGSGGSPMPTVSGGNVAYSTEIAADNEEEVSTLGVSVFGGPLLNRVDDKDERTASIGNDYDWQIAYGEAHDLASEDESSTEGKKSLYSWLSRRSSTKSESANYGLGFRRTSILSKDDSFEVQFDEVESDEQFEVAVPPGKLGMVIDTPNGSVPVVHAIRPDSVMADRVRIGDQLISVDDEDVTTWTSIQVCKLIASKSDQDRLLVFFRSHHEHSDSIQA